MARGNVTIKTKTKARPKARSKARPKTKAKAKTKGKTRPSAAVAGVFKRALAALERESRARESKMRDELNRLARIIDAARADVAAIRPDEVKQQFISTATDELDAIVQATAEATNAIMDAAEKIESVMGALQGQAAGTLMEATTGIYEACGFQDITGQRISKVVKAIKQIEERIDVLLAAFGGGGAVSAAATKTRAKPAAADSSAPITDADLLNGPQLKSKAKTQAEIDAMLSGSGR